MGKLLRYIRIFTDELERTSLTGNPSVSPSSFHSIKTDCGFSSEITSNKSFQGESETIIVDLKRIFGLSLSSSNLFRKERAAPVPVLIDSPLLTETTPTRMTLLAMTFANDSAASPLPSLPIGTITVFSLRKGVFIFFSPW